MNSKTEHPSVAPVPVGQPALAVAAGQLTLFGGLLEKPVAASEVPAMGERPTGKRRIVHPRLQGPAPGNPHLIAARQLSRRIRRLREHSPEETLMGLAICRELKAYLDDDADLTH